MLIFPCVPKAARRFLIEKLLAEFSEWRYHELYLPMEFTSNVRPRLGSDELERFSQNQLSRWEAVKDSKAIDFLFGLIPASRFQKSDDDFSFTFIRDPLDRFYSCYKHGHLHVRHQTERSMDASGTVNYRQRYPEMVDLFQLDFRSFVDRFIESNGTIRFQRNDVEFGPIRETFFLPQYLDQHNFVGIMEEMTVSLNILNDLLGANLVNDMRINVTSELSLPKYREAELERLFRKDIATYQHYRMKIAS